jgi:hypothetical protein
MQRAVARERLLKIPITGSCCCARAAIGHATAPPSSDMNWRRFTADASRASDKKE